MRCMNLPKETGLPLLLNMCQNYESNGNYHFPCILHLETHFCVPNTKTSARFLRLQPNNSFLVERSGGNWKQAAEMNKDSQVDHVS